MTKAIPQGKWSIFKNKIKLIKEDGPVRVGSIKEQRKAIKRNKEAKKR